jgi:hypothetical protein
MTETCLCIEKVPRDSGTGPKSPFLGCVLTLVDNHTGRTALLSLELISEIGIRIVVPFEKIGDQD